MNSEQNPEHLQRRKFFLDAARRAMKPLAELLEKRIELPIHLPMDSPKLRPPGAIAESTFNETCHRCRACVDICPAHAIFSLGEDASDAAGTPVIDPDNAACVVCEGLQCTHICPSGALLPVMQPADIRMGIAEVYKPNCVRTEFQREVNAEASGSHPQVENCTLCVDRCPLSATAIRFNDDGPPEVLDGCVGCGVCQLYCPTTPKAIVVQPA